MKRRRKQEMAKRILPFGIIGCGLMGREFASAVARWSHLLDQDVTPRIVGVCDTNVAALDWFQAGLDTIEIVTTDYRDLLDASNIEAIYCALPHNLHAQFYCDVISVGKHLLGEKPFGIDLAANNAILAAINEHPEVLVRCSSEFPFFPGPYQMARWVREERFGRIIEVEAGFWHSSDLDPSKPINWKRRIATNGAYGCMGDLGMHVVHLPFRFGWYPRNVRALLSQVVKERPDTTGQLVQCETWDNAILACEVETEEQSFPMMLSTKRIAPGHANTWFLRIQGTRFSAEYSTKRPKQIASLPYTPGGEQAWHVADVPHRSAYPTITGEIFEFGFSDSILQMWAAFCDEVVHGVTMRQPLTCATPQETSASHTLFTAALESQRTGQVVALAYSSNAFADKNANSLKRSRY